MSVTQTTIDLLDVWVFKCHCSKLPHIGYDKHAKPDEKFLCGCPECKTPTQKGATIEEAVKKWNSWVAMTDEDVDDMEGLHWEPDPCNLEEGEQK